MAKETTQEYIDRYWRKVSNRSTTRDKLTELQLDIARVEERTQKVASNIGKVLNAFDEIGKLRDDQIKPLDDVKPM